MMKGAEEDADDRETQTQQDEGIQSHLTTAIGLCLISTRLNATVLEVTVRR
jgi:hypothetical protein